MLKHDELFIASTDTIVGIGGTVSKKNAQAIYMIKKRPLSKPLIIMVGSLGQARELNGWNQKAEALARQYWPGAVTLVVSDRLAVRMPKCKQLCDLILDLGPVYMTSANISGAESLAFNAAKKQFPMIKKHYDFCVGSNKPSTIIDINTKEVLR